MSRLTIPVTSKDHVEGSAKAALTLVEYGDYQCPLCRMTGPIIKKMRLELGECMRFVFRHFPLKLVHPYAQMAAEVVEAAALQNQFWEMHYLLYNQKFVLHPDLFLELAASLSLNLAQFQADRQSAAVLGKIQEDFQGGVRSGVNGTPCFYINEERYDGDLSYVPFTQVLREICVQPK